MGRTILSHFEQPLHIASNRHYTPCKQLLAEIQGWFTEGFDTADLQEATNCLRNSREIIPGADPARDGGQRRVSSAWPGATRNLKEM
jgi:hypothetical protein